MGAEGGRRPPPGSRNAAGGARGGQQQQQATIYKQVDCSDLNVEEDIQREKLKGATEIAEGLRDVQETFDEFGRLIQHQQTGLDNMEQNVDNSVKHTQKGTENLRGANKEQKKSRKCMFILIGILAVVLCVIVIVVVVVTKK